MNKTPSLSDDANAVAEDKQQQQQQQQRGGYSSWWSWRRSGGGSSADKGAQQQHDGKHSESGGSGNEKDTDTSPVGLSAGHTSQLPTGPNGSPPPSPGMDVPASGNGSEMARVPLGETDDGLFNRSQDLSEEAHAGEMYRKSLRLTSKQIESLNLKHGMNEISFSVTTAYQGTSRCKCYLFRWKHSDKVVISDIDGTITKSDVLGHILPMVGRDWAQIGVAQLFSKIEENGYKLLYLSARAIGQSRVSAVTRLEVRRARLVTSPLSRCRRHASICARFARATLSCPTVRCC